MAGSSVCRGSTSTRNEREAIREISGAMRPGPYAGVIIFSSSVFDHVRLQEALSTDPFGDASCVVGCTSSGELSPRGYEKQALTAIGFPLSEFSVCAVRFDNADEISMLAIKEKTEALLDQSLVEAGRLGPRVNRAAVLLIDGMCMREEAFASGVRQALGDIPLVGGSAGDHLEFRETRIFHDGKFSCRAALLMVISSTRKMLAFSHHHLQPTEQRLVVTCAEPARRIVTEINAAPAADEYKRIIGLSNNDQLGPAIFALHPLLVKMGGEYYVRAIREENADGSLTFFSAVDEGIVLRVAEARSMERSLEEKFSEIEDNIGSLDVVLGFDCVHRRVEAEYKQKQDDVSAVLARHNVIGCGTYGEQFNGLHVNHTLTGLAIAKADAR